MSGPDVSCSGTKLCSGCSEVLSVLCFGVDRKTPDGLAYKCRSCNAKSRSQEKHRVKLRLESAEKRIKSLECKYPPALRDY